METSSKDLKGGLKVNPTKRIRDAILKEEYLTAFSHAVTYFVLFGFILLERKLKGKVGDDKLELVNVPGIIILLYVLGIIKQPEYNTMMTVKSARNKMIHPKGGVMYVPDDEERRAISKSVAYIEGLLEKI